MGVGLAPNVKRGYAHDPHYGLRRQQEWSHCLRTYTERYRVLGEALRWQVQAGRFNCRSIPDRPSALSALQVAARLEAGQTYTHVQSMLRQGLATSWSTRNASTF